MISLSMTCGTTSCIELGRRDGRWKKWRIILGMSRKRHADYTNYRKVYSHEQRAGLRKNSNTSEDRARAGGVVMATSDIRSRN